VVCPCWVGLVDLDSEVGPVAASAFQVEVFQTRRIDLVHLEAAAIVPADQTAAGPKTDVRPSANSLKVFDGFDAGNRNAGSKETDWPQGAFRPKSRPA
jgi:hypothetical protein